MKLIIGSYSKYEPLASEHCAAPAQAVARQRFCTRASARELDRMLRSTPPRGSRLKLRKRGTAGEASRARCGAARRGAARRAKHGCDEQSKHVQAGGEPNSVTANAGARANAPYSCKTGHRARDHITQRDSYRPGGARDEVARLTLTCRNQPTWCTDLRSASQGNE